ncbi:hypothetical protein ACHWQZ_G003530 [Mnemiopsis leidyi]
MGTTNTKQKSGATTAQLNRWASRFFISTNSEKSTAIKEDAQITVINISNTELSHSQAQLLSKSLKFNVSTDISEFTKLDFLADAELLIQKIKHKSYHFNKPNNNPNSEVPIVKNKSQRRTATTNPDILKLQDTIHETVQSCFNRTNKSNNEMVHNVTQSERAALRELQNNYELVIREADKGSAVVLMNSTFYCNAATTLLQSDRYKKRPDLSKDGAIKKLRSARKQIINEFRLTLLKDEIDFLENFEESLAHLYLNPKIHKSKQIIDAVTKCQTTILSMEQPTDLPFRPIISGTRCPLKRLAALVHKLLEPFPKKVSSFVQDTWDLLRKLPNTVQPGSELISLDVKDLYTNIDNDLGFKAVEYYMDKHPELTHIRLGKNFILRSLQTLQENILYEFNGEIYSQENGCAMGKDYGPTWATLAVGYLEETKLYPQIRRHYPTEIADKFEKDYQRFQDDTLLINEHGVSKDLILELFNNLHPQLEFTSENSETELPFLDVLITIQDTTIETQIYHKKTDSFNYLHFGSNHPWHTKRNIPYSLARRIRGIVSNKGHRIQSYLELRKRLITKKYPRPLIDDALKKAESTPRLTIINSGASKNAKEQTNITTLVTTHHPVLDKIGAEIVTISARAGLDCLKGTKLVHAKRQPPNLKRLLTRTNIFTKPKKGVIMCNKPRCGLCIHGHNNLLEGESIKLKNGKVITANKLINCDSTNLVYCIICPKCSEFYVGECKTLRARMNLHRNHSNPGNITTPPLKVNQHLKTCADGHFLVFPFHVVHTNHQITREAYEKHFQKVLQPTLH